MYETLYEMIRGPYKTYLNAANPTQSIPKRTMYRLRQKKRSALEELETMTLAMTSLEETVANDVGMQDLDQTGEDYCDENGYDSDVTLPDEPDQYIYM